MGYIVTKVYNFGVGNVVEIGDVCVGCVMYGFIDVGEGEPIELDV